MNKLKRGLKSNFWLIIAISLSILLIVLWFASLTEREMLVLFSSDALYLPSIYRDIFEHGNTVQGWTFNPAPNFVPDMLLFSTLMLITSNFLTATFLFSFIQYFLIIFLFYKIFRQISSIRSSVFSLSVYLFSFFLFYFLVDNDFYYSYLIMSNSYHNGTFFMALICIWLSIKFLKKESWSILAFLFLFSAIAYPCDRLFLAVFILPALFTSIILLITERNKKKICKIGIAYIFGLLLGMVIFDKFTHNSVFHLTQMHQLLNWENIISALNILSTQLKIYLFEISFKSLTITLSILSFIGTVYYCISQFIKIKQRKQEVSLFFIWETFILFFTPIVMLIPVLNGNYLGFDCIRYNYFVFIILLFNLIALLNHFFEKHQRVIMGINGFFAITLTIYLSLSIYRINFVSGFKNYFSTYTDRTHSVDKQFTENKTVIYGITNDYWYAKHVTMFSRNNIRLHATSPDAMPYTHVTNKNWYFSKGNWKYANPQFTFLLWDSDLPLPDFFAKENPTLESCIVNKNKTLYFVKPFIFTLDSNQALLIKSVTEE